MSRVSLQITQEKSVTMRHAFENIKWMSSDPEASIEARWGLDKCSIIAIHLKGARESIAFIRQHYAKSDLKFAESSLRNQQAIVDRMMRESKSNSCVQ